MNRAMPAAWHSLRPRQARTPKRLRAARILIAKRAHARDRLLGPIDPFGGSPARSVISVPPLTTRHLRSGWSIGSWTLSSGAALPHFSSARAIARRTCLFRHHGEPTGHTRRVSIRIVTGGIEQTARAADQQLPASRVVGRLEDMLRRFEPGAPPPVGARELLRELHDALAEGHPGEVGLAPDQCEAARAIAATGLASLEDDRPEAQGREVEKAVRGLGDIFEHEPRTRSRARGSWVIWGVVFFAIVGYALSRIAPPSSVIPRRGAFVGNAPQGPSRFQISFSVSGSAIRNSDIARQAQCRSGKEWDDHAFSPYAPLSDWTEDGQDYVTANANGITEHVHVIEDNGHFTSPTRAAGTFSLSIVLDENGRQIDTCKTGTIHWTARASS